MEPMEEIWETVSQPAPDGKRYLTFKDLGGLSFLYVTGFVDIKKYSFKEWIDSFLPSRQKDGSYLVSHDGWREKKKFRYEGPVTPPFDPNAIVEEEYTEADFIQLINDRVVPNTFMIEEKAVPELIQRLKAAKKIKDGKIFVDRAVKKGITLLVDQYPSPRRVLELMTFELKKVNKAEGEKARRGAEKSGFKAGRTAQEIAATRLAEMSRTLRAAGVPMPSIPGIPGIPEVSLKDLKKRKTPQRA